MLQLRWVIYDIEHVPKVGVGKAICEKTQTGGYKYRVLQYLGHDDLWHEVDVVFATDENFRDGDIVRTNEM